MDGLALSGGREGSHLPAPPNAEIAEIATDYKRVFLPRLARVGA